MHALLLSNIVIYVKISFAGHEVQVLLPYVGRFVKRANVTLIITRSYHYVRPCLAEIMRHVSPFPNSVEDIQDNTVAPALHTIEVLFQD